MSIDTFFSHARFPTRTRMTIRFCPASYTGEAADVLDATAVLRYLDDDTAVPLDVSGPDKGAFTVSVPAEKVAQPGAAEIVLRAHLTDGRRLRVRDILIFYDSLLSYDFTPLYVVGDGAPEQGDEAGEPQ
jgi:hypothetical protein